ncbi:SWI/SNF-related matrix-associated actin-dependent regulator of chromatin subfamily A member 5 [Orchesella cincta]|uniref:SWI/SNF-related matrix-associated actin-dependent regulator of chromatin subfamily A member 5 n=1 Tax=Orchesella cincta TaxID=48709 RepID=A0A1D2N4A2_ORCCI|nr:SWI/SNF-related matrix-associated actin-dependent regulator of chromatin subfamily A member 5 [Orchesella cincta]
MAKALPGSPGVDLGSTAVSSAFGGSTRDYAFEPLSPPTSGISTDGEVSGVSDTSSSTKFNGSAHSSPSGSGSSMQAPNCGVSSNRSGKDNGFQILQTTEDLQHKIESDRGKRFEYLLKQTEIFGHFMKPAYEEALQFENDESQKTVGSTSGASEGLAAALPGPSKNERGRFKKKPHLAPFKNVSASSSKSDSQTSKNYDTHFDTTPAFIQWGSMRDYQVRGLNWLISLYERGISGILADEMGLGKTVQTIALLGYLKHHRRIDGPHLVIAPKSTLPNWMNEIKRWCPTLKAICLIGGKEERPGFIKNTFLPRRWNVCITSYEMARIEKSTLAKVNYHYIVIDEAQKIKNENSLLAICVRQFTSTARLLLTGTPLQNNLHELWALLNFLLPDVFYSSEDFDSWFNENNCMDNQSLIDRLHAVLRPFLLRRIKADVEKTLPPKNEMRLYVQLTAMQKEWYRKILLNDIDVINDKTGKVTKMRLYNVLMHLKKVCNHPYLFEGAEPKPFTTDSHIVTNSGKMVILDKLLMKLKAQQSRVLIFCQMTRLLDILEDYCIWRNFEYCRLDGSTDYDIRQEDIDDFNAPNSTKFIYLLSTRAGGLGINLATANIVILYDSDWNPQVDLQAMDRAHRIGQTKEVKVFRFVCEDTAEEKIIERAAAKLHLDRMVIQQGRLVASDRTKPSKPEILSVVRFGAEKILKSGTDAGISDADIDTVLAQSKIRSEAFDRQLESLTEDNLKELKVEQVEFTYQKPVPEKQLALFDFEGKDYRELRKRNIKAYMEHDLDSVAGKRRKDINMSLHAESPERDENMKFDDDEFQDPTIDVKVTKTKKHYVNHKPHTPQDFQFYSPYFWELYWRELDYYHRKLTDFVPNVCCELSADDQKQLSLAELTRLKSCEQFSGIESREKSMLKNESFSAWKQNHFDQFISAVVKYGTDNLEQVAQAVKKKEMEEVVAYSQVFWIKCHELFNFEEVMKKLDKQELVKERRKAQHDILKRKFQHSDSGSGIKLVYEPGHWMGKRFSKEDDIKLLSCLMKIGLLTPNVFEVLRLKLSLAEEEEFSPFLRTRTSEELYARFNLLMYMTQKELKCEVCPGTFTFGMNTLGRHSEDSTKLEKEDVKPNLNPSVSNLKSGLAKAPAVLTPSRATVKKSNDVPGTPKTSKKRKRPDNAEGDSPIHSKFNRP